MSLELPSALDNLAANKIIDFDADAYVKGETPRYVGNPPIEGLPFETPLPAFREGEAPKFHEQPKHDKFINKERKEVGGKNEKKSTKVAAWKKVLAGILLVGGLIFVGGKYKSAIKPFFKSKIKPALQNGWTAVKGFFTKFRNWTKGLGWK